MNLQNKAKSLFHMDGSQLMDLPIKTCKILSQQPTSTWSQCHGQAGRTFQSPDCYKSTVQVQPSVEISLNASASHYEIMTALRDKVHRSMAWDPCVPSESSNGTSIGVQTLFWNGTDCADGSDYDVNACWYYRLPADSYAAIDMGEPEATPVMRAVISCLMSALTGGENCLYFGESTTTPSTQLRQIHSEAMESLLISGSTTACDDGALLHLGEQPTTPIAQAILGATAVECIPISATVSNVGACKNEFVIHYEGAMDVAQPLPLCPGMDLDPSATLESSVVLHSQEPVGADT